MQCTLLVMLRVKPLSKRCWCALLLGVSRNVSKCALQGGVHGLQYNLLLGPTCMELVSLLTRRLPCSHDLG